MPWSTSWQLRSATVSKPAATLETAQSTCRAKSAWNRYAETRQTTSTRTIARAASTATGSINVFRRSRARSAIIRSTPSRVSTSAERARSASSSHHRPSPSCAEHAPRARAEVLAFRGRGLSNAERSASRRARDAELHPRDLLQLLGELQSASRRAARSIPSRRGVREPEKQPAPELVMVPLVGLDDVPIERRRRLVATALAKADELVVPYDGQSFARELSGGDALDGRLERAQVLEHRRRRRRVEPARVDTELAQATLDQPVVLGLIAHLPGQGELDVHLSRRRDPAGRTLGRLDLVLERHLEQPGAVDGGRPLT